MARDLSDVRADGARVGVKVRQGVGAQRGAVCGGQCEGQRWALVLTGHVADALGPIARLVCGADVVRRAVGRASGAEVAGRQRQGRNAGPVQSGRTAGVTGQLSLRTGGGVWVRPILLTAVIL